MNDMNINAKEELKKKTECTYLKPQNIFSRTRQFNYKGENPPISYHAQHFSILVLTIALFSSLPILHLFNFDLKPIQNQCPYHLAWAALQSDGIGISNGGSSPDTIYFLTQKNIHKLPCITSQICTWKMVKMHCLHLSEIKNIQCFEPSGLSCSCTN